MSCFLTPLVQRDLLFLFLLLSRPFSARFNRVHMVVNVADEEDDAVEEEKVKTDLSCETGSELLLMV